MAPPVTRSRKLRQFLRLLVRETKGDVVEAAQRAGYRNPSNAGPQIERRFPQLVAQARSEYRASLKVSADEAEEILAEIARDKGHKDRVRAAETYLKLHGRLSEKLDVKVDRASLTKALDEEIAALTAARQAQRNRQPTGSNRSDN